MAAGFTGDGEGRTEHWRANSASLKLSLFCVSSSELRRGQSVNKRAGEEGGGGVIAGRGGKGLALAFDNV